MTTTEDAYQWHDRNLVGPDGSKIGSIKDVYLDDRTGKPEWATVSTGMFGTKSSFVPLADARSQGDDVTVPFDKNKVKDAPNVDADEHLDPEEERELYRYYGVSYDEGAETTGRTETVTTGGDRDVDVDRGRTVAADTSGPETDSAMTRSEEEISIGKRTQEAGKAVLRKYIVTENVTKTVPVQREEVRIEREPITDANRGDAMSGRDLTEEEAEVTLHEEVIDVDKKVVPKERVRLDTETVQDEETVTEEVRKERIETDGGIQDDKKR